MPTPEPGSYDYPPGNAFQPEGAHPGHLIPEPERTRSGYRVFTDRHLRLLEFISRAKRLGLPLEEIRTLAEVWGREDCRATHDQLLALIESQLTEVRHRIGDLVLFRELLEDVHAELPVTPRPPVAGRTAAVTSRSGGSSWTRRLS